MGINAFIRMRYLSYNNDWFIRFYRMESDSNFIKLHCIDAYFKYGDEYSFYCKIFTIEKEFPDLTKNEIVLNASKKMMLPILYTALTTICAFLSLVLSGIKPIIDFGWMMTLGLIVSFLVTFLLLPSLINILASEE